MKKITIFIYYILLFIYCYLINERFNPDPIQLTQTNRDPEASLGQYLGRVLKH